MSEAALQLIPTSADLSSEPTSLPRYDPTHNPYAISVPRQKMKVSLIYTLFAFENVQKSVTCHR
jgi:hypothetical protein